MIDIHSECMSVGHKIERPLFISLIMSESSAFWHMSIWADRCLCVSLKVYCDISAHMRGDLFLCAMQTKTVL